LDKDGEMRIAYFDVEAWDLSPEFAPLLCASILDANTNEMITLRQDKYLRRGNHGRGSGPKVDGMADDEQLLLDLKGILSGYHLTCGWYSKGYDIPLINTRLVKYGHKPLDSFFHLDGTWYFRGWRGIKPKTSKLKHVAEFFDFEQKPEVMPDVWLNARGGSKKAMDEVVARCEADVRITRACIEKVLDMGLAKNIQRYP
jgi:uncharacterized protein YprB with RNaseH-like and TPR domain